MPFKVLGEKLKNMQPIQEKKKKGKTRVSEDFRTLLSIMCGTTSLKISKDIQDLKNTIKQINLPCIRTLCPTVGEESACKVGDLGSVPGLGRSSGEGNGYPLQYSGLENSMHCIVHRVAKSQT